MNEKKFKIGRRGLAELADATRQNITKLERLKSVQQLEAEKPFLERECGLQVIKPASDLLLKCDLCMEFFMSFNGRKKKCPNCKDITFVSIEEVVE